MKRKRLARDSGALLVSLVVAVVLVAVPATRATAVAPDPENCSVTNSVTPGITAASADVQTTGVAQRGVGQFQEVGFEDYGASGNLRRNSRNGGPQVEL